MGIVYNMILTVCFDGHKPSTFEQEEEDSSIFVDNISTIELLKFVVFANCSPFNFRFNKIDLEAKNDILRWQ